ncbi:MAG: hypothetical protein V1817_00875 [Candidatus Micrarchaeota archaeon]
MKKEASEEAEAKKKAQAKKTVGGKVGKIIACFKALGFKPAVNDFESRLIAQKLVYLLELAGFDFGFAFELNARGPYSHAFTVEFFGNRAGFETLATKEELTAREAKTVGALKEFELNPGRLEAAAAYAFFVKQGLSAADAWRKLKADKPFLRGSDVCLGVNAVKPLLFKPTKEDMEELRKECAPWQELAAETLRRFD